MIQIFFFNFKFNNIKADSNFNNGSHHLQNVNNFIFSEKGRYLKTYVNSKIQDQNSFVKNYKIYIYYNKNTIFIYIYISVIQPKAEQRAVNSFTC